MNLSLANLQRPKKKKNFSFKYTSKNTLAHLSGSSNGQLGAMHQNDQSSSQDSDATSWLWKAPTSQPRQRPATIHAGLSYYTGRDFTSFPLWESPPSPQPSATEDTTPQTLTIDQELYPTSLVDNTFWDHKSCDDAFDIEGFETEMSIDPAYSTDDGISLLDLKFPRTNQDIDPFKLGVGIDPRRMSGSSFTMSTTGALSDMASYDEFSTALSEAPSFSSDYPPPSNRTSLLSSTHLSPVASPRMTPQNRSELGRTQSRGRTSPSPRPNVRSAPYSIENAAKNKRWSTGSYAPIASRRTPAPFVFQAGPTSSMVQHGFQSTEHQNFFVSGMQAYSGNNMFVPSHLPSQVPSQVPSQQNRRDTPIFEAPAPLMSQGLFRMLQSNANPAALHGHYHDLSDPPDLFSSLQEEQLAPPPEDMEPSDPDLVPHEQDLRFEGDLYTPKWVRGHGNKREGWCGICKPGRWLVLKNSAFWYDKSFTHGISAASGNPFQEPQDTRRMDGNPDVWEGLCGSCNEWIALVSSKKKGTTWFRHAYKCQSHPKIKDGAKRRREGSNARGPSSAASSSTASRPKLEQTQQRPVTPHTTTMSGTSSSSMPTSVVTPTSAPQQTTPQLKRQSGGSSHPVTPVPPPQLPRELQRLPAHLLGSNDPYPTMI